MKFAQHVRYVLWITNRVRVRIGHTVRVRWDDLFDDLASQFAAEHERARLRDAVDDERLRIARLTLRQRLAALEAGLTPGEVMALELRDGERIEIEPVEFGADWFAARITAPARHYTMTFVPLQGISSLLLTRSQLERSLVPMPERPDSLAARLGFVMPLRDLARRRVHCELTTTLGVLHGTIDRVGRDHLDLAVHDGDTPRRTPAVVVYRVVALADVVVVRAAEDVRPPR